MGSNLAKQTAENIVNNSTRNTQVLTQDISASNVQQFGVNQKVDVSVKGTLNCVGDLLLINEGKSNQTGISRVDVSAMADMAAQVEQNVMIATVSELEQVNADFNFFQFNISETITKAFTDNSVTNVQTITQKIRSTISQTTTANQTIYLTVTESGTINVGGDCVFTNEMSNEMVATNAVQACIDAMMETTTVKEVIAVLEAHTSQANEGINVTAIIIGVCVALGLILIIGLGAKFGMDAARKKKMNAAAASAPAPAATK